MRIKIALSFPKIQSILMGTRTGGHIAVRDNSKTMSQTIRDVHKINPRDTRGYQRAAARSSLREPARGVPRVIFNRPKCFGKFLFHFISATKTRCLRSRSINCS